MAIRRLQYLLRLAARNFTRFRLQAALIIVASMTGTAGVLVSSGYASGGQRKILDQLSSLGTNLIIVTPQQSRAVGGRARTGGLVTTLTSADYRAILQSVDVTSSSPTVSAVLRVRAADLTRNTAIVGCTPEYFAIQRWLPLHGDLFNDLDDRKESRVAMLGANAARDLFGAVDPTGTRININRVPFTVVGVLAERGQGLDAANLDDQIFIPLQTAMHRLMNVGYYNAIFVTVGDLSRLRNLEESIRSLLELRHRHSRNSEDDFLVQNRKSLIDTQLRTFARLAFLVRWIALSALTVSMLGVFSVNSIAIRNRTQEIGTRRAVGGTQADILLQFFAEGALGIMLGGGAGLLVAPLLLSILDRLLHQPMVFSLPPAAAQTVALVAIYLCFTVVPCIRALKIDPSVALRSE